MEGWQGPSAHWGGGGWGGGRRWPRERKTSNLEAKAREKKGSPKERRGRWRGAGGRDHVARDRVGQRARPRGCYRRSPLCAIGLGREVPQPMDRPSRGCSPGQGSGGRTDFFCSRTCPRPTRRTNEMLFFLAPWRLRDPTDAVGRRQTPARSGEHRAPAVMTAPRWALVPPPRRRFAFQGACALPAGGSGVAPGGLWQNRGQKSVSTRRCGGLSGRAQVGGEGERAP